MFKNSLSRFMILTGLTLTLPLGMNTSPVLAQTSNNFPCPVVTPVTGVTTYCFPATGTLPNIAYVTSNTSTSNGIFYYGNQVFTGNQISIVNSPIGEQVTVDITGAFLLGTIKFTLLLPNDKPPILNGSITAVGITVENLIEVVPPRETTTYQLLQGIVKTGS